MKNFVKLAVVNVDMLRHALIVADLWPKDGSPLYLRGLSGPTEFWSEIPQVRPIIFDLMRGCEASHLGVVAVEMTKPGEEASYPGEVAIYEVVLQAFPGVTIASGEETVQLTMGDIWRWRSEDKQAIRRNLSHDDSISMMIGLETT